MSDDKKSGESLGRVRFFYIKGQAFRVIHVDGALGGITPRGLIHMSVYSERAAIPQSSEHDITSDGRLGKDPVRVEGKEGIVREIDADLIMTKETATDLRDWIDARLAEFDKLSRGESD